MEYEAIVRAGGGVYAGVVNHARGQVVRFRATADGELLRLYARSLTVEVVRLTIKNSLERERAEAWECFDQLDRSYPRF